MDKKEISIAPERRYYDSTVTLEQRGEGNEVIAGYALKFNTISQDLGGYFETILPGAADDVLDQDIRALENHDKNLILGRNGTTLALEVDSTGLHYRITPPATTFAQDLKESIKRGDITGSSFMFNIAPGGTTWVEREDGTLLRQITKFSRIHDVGPVTFPAYLDSFTEVARREMAEFTSQRDKAQGDGQAAQAQIHRDHNHRARTLQLKDK